MGLKLYLFFSWWLSQVFCSSFPDGVRVTCAEAWMVALRSPSRAELFMLCCVRYLSTLGTLVTQSGVYSWLPTLPLCRETLSVSYTSYIWSGMSCRQSVTLKMKFNLLIVALHCTSFYGFQRRLFFVWDFLHHDYYFCTMIIMIMYTLICNRQTANLKNPSWCSCCRMVWHG